MKKTNNTSVIIPIHELSTVTKVTLDNAIKSVEIQKEQPDEVLIVAAKEVHDYIINNVVPNSELPIRVILNEGETDYCSQINLGVSQLKTDWFTVLNYDDEYSAIWIKSALTYRDAHPEVSVFLPIIVNADVKNNFRGDNNEAVWANEFSDELGFLDNTALLANPNFSIDGMFMSKEVFEEVGGLKPSIKLTFVYEFLLRLTNLSHKIMVVPRYGYVHVVEREGSLFHTYKTEMTADEKRWWMSLAKREYHHIKDRNIKYEKENS